jgi:YVTN family beta-propeller protein
MRYPFFFLILIALAGCKHEPFTPQTSDPIKGGYPAAIGKIVNDRCVNCHNAASASLSGGLNMESWDLLFNGAASGAAVIPYHIDNSVLLHYINTYSDLGPTAQPIMPVAGTVLSREEVLQFKDWILRGAPDANGKIAFASNADTRQKIYITMQGCDLLGVIDAERKVLMRYIKVGKSDAIEIPHAVRVSPDGRYAYVSFTSGDYVQKIDTRTNEIVGEINLAQYIQQGSWNVLHISPDGNYFIISDFKGEGSLLLVQTSDMTLKRVLGYKGMISPHAEAATPSFDTFYVTAQNGNVVYKIAASGQQLQPIKVSLDGNTPVEQHSLTSPDPHEILMAPDHSKYFVACQNTNDVRVVDAHTNAILATVPVGGYPQEIAVSSTKPWIFVTCMNDSSRLPGYKGSVYVIDYNTHQIVRRIDGPFWQPHGITVDDRAGIVYVISANQSENGIPPHHVSACAGRNGWYTLVDLNTLQPLRNTRYELSVYPYSADTRFK